MTRSEQGDSHEAVRGGRACRGAQYETRPARSRAVLCCTPSSREATALTEWTIVTIVGIYSAHLSTLELLWQNGL